MCGWAAEKWEKGRSNRRMMHEIRGGKGQRRKRQTRVERKRAKGLKNSGH